MDRNEAIKQVKNLICLGRNRPRAGWAAGYRHIDIAGAPYCTVHCFNSDRSACFKSVVQFLQDHNVPHFVEYVDRCWDGVKVFHQVDVVII